MGKQILLATLGTTPQIVTEAVYFHRTQRGVQFDEIAVITTRPGRDVLLRSLFGASRRPGNFAKLCQRVGIPYGHTLFSEKTVTVLSGADGRPLDDIRTSADSEAVAEQILGVVRDVCAQKETALHATIAGGRKTMGVYLHSVLQMLGRSQDRLFHILTHPLVEEQILRGAMRDFYYPTRDLRLDGQLVRKEEILDCVEIPLLHWPAAMRPAGEWTYRDLVAQRRQEIQFQRTPGRIVVDWPRRVLRVGDRTVALSPKQFFWYCYFALTPGKRFNPRSVANHLEVSADGRHVKAIAVSAETNREILDQVRSLQQLHGRLHPHDTDEFWRILRTDCTGEPPGVANVVCKINTVLRKELQGLAGPYLIQGGRGAGYGLALPANLIALAT